MVVKVYISGISGNKEVKKRQQRVLMILDSKNIKYEVIDITEPGRENDKDFMQNNAKSSGGTVSDPNPRSPLPPQLFNDEEYCGDYDQFDLANEVDTLEQFVKVEVPPEEPPQASDTKAVNGDVSVDKNNKESKENSQERDNVDAEKPDQNTETEDSSPAKEDSDVKEGLPAKDGSISREPTPATEEAPSKKASPPKESGDEHTTKEDSPAKETVVEKEKSPVKDTELETNKTSKESSPVKEESVNENGTVSSRGLSEEKDGAVGEVEESKKDNPSEALIQSEQTASAE